MEFPPWLVLALISPVFWAIVNVLDSYCVDEVFDRPWVGMITSALAMLAALPFLAVGLIFTGVSPMSAETVGLCVLSGFVFMASQFLYFKVLSVTESGIVAAYWNMIPLFLAVVSFLLLEERLTEARYAGIAVLILASVAFCLLDGSLESRWSSFWMMFAGAWLQVAYFLVQKQVFAISPVYQAFLLITLSMVVAGLSTLLLPRCRRIFRGNWPRIRPTLRLLFGIEVANLIAIATGQYAVSYGMPSLVSAVEASLPAYTFVLSLVLFAVTRKYGEQEARQWLPAKFLLVTAMVFGVWLVS